MRILLTGASGQVGGALLPLLRDRHSVIAPASGEFDLSQPQTLPERLDGAASCVRLKLIATMEQPHPLGTALTHEKPCHFVPRDL